MCGCGGRQIDWDEIRRQIEESEREDEPTEVTEEFETLVHVEEEVEAE